MDQLQIRRRLQIYFILVNIIYFIMFSRQATDLCLIPFLDCRGYYDLASEIIGLIVAAFILYWSLVNFRQLKQQKNGEDDSEYEHSLRRKIMINLSNGVFLTVLILHILFSMVLFQVVSQQTPQDIIRNNLEKWYKSTQMLFVELLNGLLLIVALLYWHGLYFFFKVKDLSPPLAFGQAAKYCIYLCGAYCFCTFVIGIVFIFELNSSDLFLVNFLMLLSCAISMSLFIFFRISYYRNIFRSIRLREKVINRQRIYNTLIISSSMARMTLCLLEMEEINLASLRRFSSDCYDTEPFHAIVLLSITIGVDLLPSFVFSRIFTTLQRQRFLHQTDANQTLFSVQPSEIVSATTYQ